MKEEILEKCRKNLDYYNIKKYTLFNHNSEKIDNKFDCIITDLPYGKSTKAENPEKLFFNFLSSAHHSAESAVAGFPDFFPAEKIISQAGWKIRNEFTIYLHKSLRRRIFVLR